MKTLILGATSGIARALAGLLARRGDELLLAGRDRNELDRIAADLFVRHDAVVSTVRWDANDPYVDVELETALAAADRIVVAAGQLSGSEEAITRSNYSGLLPVIERVHKGRVVVLSSVAGDRLRASNRVYGAAKAALNQRIDALRAERPQVRYTIIKLGPVDTEMTFGGGAPMMAAPADVAQEIVRALDEGVDVAYVPARWRFIMTIVRALPQPIVDKLK